MIRSHGSPYRLSSLVVAVTLLAPPLPALALRQTNAGQEKEVSQGLARALSTTPAAGLEERRDVASRFALPPALHGHGGARQATEFNLLWHAARAAHEVGLAALARADRESAIAQFRLARNSWEQLRPAAHAQECRDIAAAVLLGPTTVRTYPTADEVSVGQRVAEAALEFALQLPPRRAGLEEQGLILGPISQDQLVPQIAAALRQVEHDAGRALPSALVVLRCRGGALSWPQRTAAVPEGVDSTSAEATIQESLEQLGILAPAGRWSGASSWLVSVEETAGRAQVILAPLTPDMAMGDLAPVEGETFGLYVRYLPVLFKLMGAVGGYPQSSECVVHLVTAAPGTGVTVVVEESGFQEAMARAARTPATSVMVGLPATRWQRIGPSSDGSGTLTLTLQVVPTFLQGGLEEARATVQGFLGDWSAATTKPLTVVAIGPSVVAQLAAPDQARLRTLLQEAAKQLVVRVVEIPPSEDMKGRQRLVDALLLLRRRGDVIVHTYGTEADPAVQQLQYYLTSIEIPVVPNSAPTGLLDFLGQIAANLRNIARGEVPDEELERVRSALDAMA